MSTEPSVLLRDIIEIIASDVAALKSASKTRLLGPDEALVLKRYADFLLDHMREQRKDAETEIADLSHEDLLEKVRQLAGGGL
ncbi:MAG: hypothetical protein M3R04_02455 [bacterium]|nr:hypothetical protein [bacterium]